MLSPRSSTAGPLGRGCFLPETPFSVPQDGVGNRLTQTAPEGTSTYTYQAGNNRLASISGPQPKTFDYDANGNTILENSRTYTYIQNDRLIQAAEGAILGEYSYNVGEQRASKTVGAQTTVFHDDRAGRIIAETQTSGVVIVEYIYLNEQPLAKAEGATLSYIHSDHLGTPQAMSGSMGTKVWEIEARPFGDGATVVGSGALNLRFPGQYFDQETGLHHNWHREYHPTVGRYLEPDPARMSSDTTPYGYVAQNPLVSIDPDGLVALAQGYKCRSFLGLNSFDKAVRDLQKVERICKCWNFFRKELGAHLLQLLDGPSPVVKLKTLATGEGGNTPCAAEPGVIYIDPGFCGVGYGNELKHIILHELAHYADCAAQKFPPGGPREEGIEAEIACFGYSIDTRAPATGGRR